MEIAEVAMKNLELLERTCKTGGSVLGLEFTEARMPSMIWFFHNIPAFVHWVPRAKAALSLQCKKA